MLKNKGRLASAIESRSSRISGIYASAGVAGIVVFSEWKIPMHLPGHRALGWLTVLFLMRLLAGRGWSSLVGGAGAALVLALGISPDGIYGVADYAIAGVLIDLVLAVRPRIASNLLKLAFLGAVVLLAVGWIAPLGRSLTGGVPLAYLWPSILSSFGGGLSRIIALDLLFGAAAGGMAWAVVTGAARVRRPAPSHAAA